MNASAPLSLQNGKQKGETRPKALNYQTQFGAVKDVQSQKASLAKLQAANSIVFLEKGDLLVRRNQKTFENTLADPTRLLENATDSYE
jgi:hypothetical protein